MRYVIFGGSGFIGRELTEYWLSEGHQVIVVGRSKPNSQPKRMGLTYCSWDDLAADPGLIEGADALVNLAGAALSQRWSTDGKQAILSSRLETVSRVAKVLSVMDPKPEVIVQASAVAIYGTSLDKVFDEASPADVSDFPSEVVQAWEACAGEAYYDIRVVKLRTGIVLGNGSGAFPKLKLPYMLGVGGRVGSGKQWLSWIHIRDMVRLIDYCVRNKAIEGAVNATAPHPVRNEDFGKMISKVYHRPHWFPLPAAILKLILGEMSEILLAGQRVIPAKVLNHGFTFNYETLHSALKQLKTE
ncbi:TIGR01777 family oxidoreductase [Paenibacillus tengchongensis]|uniref:TIGR01777 family oxidoreductase n=1 Tax=Paenibacillus tengchongensis TaxID=2608684 RepID=UPI00124BD6DB|nr:TIGR01777 family oxidoreductase [Paenibacillus tengchongensis]